MAEGSPVGTHVLRNEIRTGFLEKGLSRQQEARDSIPGGEKCVAEGHGQAVGGGMCIWLGEEGAGPLLNRLYGL